MIASGGDLASRAATRQWADGPMYVRRASAKLPPHDDVRTPFRRLAGAQRCWAAGTCRRAGNRAARLFTEPERRQFPDRRRRTFRRRRAHRSFAAGDRHRGADRRAGLRLRPHLRYRWAAPPMSRWRCPTSSADATGNIGEQTRLGHARGQGRRQAAPRHEPHRRSGDDAARVRAARAEDHAGRQPHASAFPPANICPTSS